MASQERRRVVTIPESELVQLRDELRSLRDQIDDLARRRVDVSMALQRVERMLAQAQPRRGDTIPMPTVKDQ